MPSLSPPPLWIMTGTVTHTCECGDNTRQISFRHGMPSDVLDRAFCPECAGNGYAPRGSWPIADGWELRFDLAVARMFAMARLGIDPSLVNPGFIIDGGYVV